MNASKTNSEKKSSKDLKNPSDKNSDDLKEQGQQDQENAHDAKKQPGQSPPR